MLEEEASQGQQQQTLYPHTPSAPPPVSISPSETYPMPSTHWSHSSHFRASTGTTPLSVSHSTDRMHSAMAQAKGESACLFVCLSVCLGYGHLLVCLSVYLSAICLFVCLPSGWLYVGNSECLLSGILV